MAIMGTLAFFTALSVFSIFIVQLRWCKTKKRNGSDKCHVQTLMMFSYILVSCLPIVSHRIFCTYKALASVGIFFYELNIKLMIIVTAFSNIVYSYLVVFVLGHSKTKDSKNDSSFARIRTIILITVFL